MEYVSEGTQRPKLLLRTSIYGIGYEEFGHLGVSEDDLLFLIDTLCHKFSTYA